MEQEIEQEMVEWRGYEFTDHQNAMIHSICLSEKRCEKLMEELKKYEGSQREFYFEYVNPLRLTKIRKEDRKHGHSSEGA